MRLIGDQLQHQKMWDDAEKAADQGAKAIEASTDRLSASTVASGTIVANTITAIGRKLEQLGRSAVSAFSEQEDADVALTSALESNGRAVDDTFQRYQRFAGEIQRTTRMADENVVALLTQAETFDLTGAAAEAAAKNAIGLAALPGVRGSAEAMLRLTAAMAKGNVEAAMTFARFIPQLRGIKNESEFTAKFNKLVADGFKAEAAAANTFSGALKQMGNAASDLMEDFGAVIAEGLKPLIQVLKEAAVLFKGLSPETKRWVVIALSAIPALVTLGVAMRTAGVAARFLVAGFALLVNPITLTVAAVASLGYAVLFHTKAGAAAVDWFGRQWEALEAYAGEAIQGVKDALNAGNLPLAVEIMWTQIEISWYEGLNKIKVANTSLREYWIKFRDFLASGMVIGAGLGTIGPVWKKQLDTLNEMTEIEIKNMDADMQRMKDRLKELTDQAGKEVSDKAEQAGNKAGSGFSKGLATGLGKFDAVSVYSAEATAFMLKQMDDFGGKATAKGREINKALKNVGKDVAGVDKPASGADFWDLLAKQGPKQQQQIRKRERLDKARPEDDIDKLLDKTLNLFKDAPKPSAGDAFRDAVDRAKEAMEFARKNREARVSGMTGAGIHGGWDGASAPMSPAEFAADVGRTMDKSAKDAFDAAGESVLKTSRDWQAEWQRIIDKARDADAALNEDAAAARKRFSDEAFDKMMERKKEELGLEPEAAGEGEERKPDDQAVVVNVLQEILAELRRKGPAFVVEPANL